MMWNTSLTLETGNVLLCTWNPAAPPSLTCLLSNGSKHTYVYKDNSLTVATPDVSNTDKTGVTGFDGQELPEDYSPAASKSAPELQH